MSQTVRIDLDIQDMAAFAEACKKLAVTFDANTLVLSSNGRRVAWLSRAKNGGMCTLAFDRDINYSPATKLLGVNAYRLKQEYGIAVVAKAARLKGLTVRRQQVGNAIKVTVSGARL